jgi:hypothetical protein
MYFTCTDCGSVSPGEARSLQSLAPDSGSRPIPREPRPEAHVGLLFAVLRRQTRLRSSRPLVTLFPAADAGVQADSDEVDHVLFLRMWSPAVRLEVFWRCALSRTVAPTGDNQALARTDRPDGTFTLPSHSSPIACRDARRGRHDDCSASSVGASCSLPLARGVAPRRGQAIRVIPKSGSRSAGPSNCRGPGA